MLTEVLVTRHGANHFSAWALALPAVVASGASEAEAIAQLRAALIKLQQQSHIVQVDLPLSTGGVAHPLLRFAGMWADDPDWSFVEGTMIAARQQLDDQAPPH